MPIAAALAVVAACLVGWGPRKQPISYFLTNAAPRGFSSSHL